MSQSYRSTAQAGGLNTSLNRGRLSKPPIVQPASPYLQMDEHPIAMTPELAEFIRSDAAVAIGVSGGKDSQAAAIATIRYLDHVGHAGPRLLVHADLGSVEWRDSFPTCQRLAEYLGTELVVVRRKQGDLMHRWQSRWTSNVARYQQLSTVTLVPCWSTPRMRFCTSEGKTTPIQSELKRWSPNLPIISVTGVRRQESRQRSRAGIMDHKPGERIWTWRPILDWSEDDVFSALDAWNIELHPAYQQFGLSRVSCRFCIMSSLADLTAAASQPETHDLYRQMVDLECRSTFAFQGARWLGDIAPHLLDAHGHNALAAAKANALRRVEIEQRITPPMLYVKGWPLRMLSDHEADQLAEVRRAVSDLLGFDAQYLDRASIHGRYAELIDLKAMREKAA